MAAVIVAETTANAELSLGLIADGLMIAHIFRVENSVFSISTVIGR
jgi:hypothetical protein